MIEPLTVADFCMPELSKFPSSKHSAQVIRRCSGKFLKGPICWEWLSRAAQLKGKALHVGILVWHLAGLSKARIVVLSSEALQSFGVKRTTGYRALGELESAGLVVWKRKNGRLARVTILDVAVTETAASKP